MEGIRIRWMSLDDLPQVHAIESRSFTSPWTINAFKYELTDRHTIMKVAVIDDQIVGYVCIKTFLNITHVLNLAVVPEFRRRGIGSLLLQEALEELEHQGVRPESVTLEVRESNTAAIRLYEKFGFRIIGKRRKYYQRPDEDALIMELHPYRLKQI